MQSLGLKQLLIPCISFGHRPTKHEVAYKCRISSKDYKKRFKARHASMWEMAKTYVGYHGTARDAYLIFSWKMESLHTCVCIQRRSLLFLA